LRRKVVREIQANRSANLPALFSAQYSPSIPVHYDLHLAINVTSPVEYAVSVLAGETLIAGWECIAHLTRTMSVIRIPLRWSMPATVQHNRFKEGGRETCRRIRSLEGVTAMEMRRRGKSVTR
jgi:hypothetical protein